jgi:hypothetical protein
MGLLLFFGLILGYHGLDFAISHPGAYTLHHSIQPITTIEDTVKVMDRNASAVVGATTLAEIIGSDLVTSAHFSHSAQNASSELHKFLLSSFLSGFSQLCPKHLPCFSPVGLLGPFVLHGDHGIRGYMS